MLSIHCQEYTLKFSAVMLLDAVWRLSSLQKSSLSAVDGSQMEKPRKLIVTVLNITATDAATISDAISSYLESRNLDYHKLIDQCCDWATTFTREYNGVQKRIWVHSPHSIYIQCACHRIQLASIQAAHNVPEVKKDIWSNGKCLQALILLTKKAESLNKVHSVLKLPEFKDCVT